MKIHWIRGAKLPWFDFNNFGNKLSALLVSYSPPPFHRPPRPTTVDHCLLPLISYRYPMAWTIVHKILHYFGEKETIINIVDCWGFQGAISSSSSGILRFSGNSSTSLAMIQLFNYLFIYLLHIFIYLFWLFGWLVGVWRRRN